MAKKDAKGKPEEQETAQAAEKEKKEGQEAAKTSQKPKKKKEPLTGPQKAATVMVALGVENASALYKYMSTEDVEALTLEVARLGYLDSDQTEEVLTEYYELCLANKAVTEGGMEYARTVLQKAFGEEAAESMLVKVAKSLKNRQFAFLDRADPKSLFSSLQYERAQTIALVLSYVNPEKAASVLEQFDHKRQIRVVENIARMESASPAAMKIIESELNRKFSTIISNKNEKVGGIDYVASIMNNMDRASEKNIFDGLASHDQELADEIRKRMFVFEDLVTMDDRSVQRFLRDCDPKDIVLSLKATTEEVANKLFTNMSARMAQNIRDDLEITTNVRMKDVEDAQQRIVDVIRKLEEQGEIIVIKSGKDDIIA